MDQSHVYAIVKTWYMGSHLLRTLRVFPPHMVHGLWSSVGNPDQIGIQIIQNPYEHG